MVGINVEVFFWENEEPPPGGGHLLVSMAYTGKLRQNEFHQLKHMNG